MSTYPPFLPYFFWLTYLWRRGEEEKAEVVVEDEAEESSVAEGSFEVEVVEEGKVLRTVIRTTPRKCRAQYAKQPQVWQESVSR